MFGADIRNANAGLGVTFLLDGGVVLTNIKLVAFAVALVAATGLLLFLRRSRAGRAIRATSQNARAARLMDETGYLWLDRQSGRGNSNSCDVHADGATTRYSPSRIWRRTIGLAMFLPVSSKRMLP